MTKILELVAAVIVAVTDVLAKINYMILSGVVLIGIGIFSFIRGVEMNQDTRLLIQTFPNTSPGNPLIIAGVALFAVGVLLLALVYWKKNRK